MYDRKVVRRRRAALAVFVALSIAILTAYFGESGGGFFHAFQRGAQEAFAPIETGASRALKPVRDLFGWAGDTFDAKDQNEDLKREVDRLRSGARRSADRAARRQPAQGPRGAAAGGGLPAGTEPVAAAVIARSPTVWYSSIKIDKGSSDGVKVDQPVIAAGAIRRRRGRRPGGQGHERHRRHREVTLITDASIGVAAQVMPSGATGRPPEVGNPRDLLLEFVESGRVTENTTVVTSGFKIDRASRCSRAASRSGACPTSTSTRSRSTSACTSSRSPTCKPIDVPGAHARPRVSQTAGVVVP